MVRAPGSQLSSRDTIHSRATRDGGGNRGMVRAPVGRLPAGTTHPRATAMEEVGRNSRGHDPPAGYIIHPRSRLLRCICSRGFLLDQTR